MHCVCILFAVSFTSFIFLIDLVYGIWSKFAARCFVFSCLRSWRAVVWIFEWPAILATIAKSTPASSSLLTKDLRKSGPVSFPRIASQPARAAIAPSPRYAIRCLERFPPCSLFLNYIVASTKEKSRPACLVRWATRASKPICYSGCCQTLTLLRISNFQK